MKIKKSNLIVLIIIIVLVVAFSILLVFYLKYNQKGRENYLNKEITIVYEDKQITYSFNDLKEMCPAENFQAVYKPSGKMPITRYYSGIELKDLLIALEINYQTSEGIRFKASDGLQKVYSINDIIQENNVFIAYEVNGKPFNKGIIADAYSKPEEDGGPFVVIKATDQFSQNRVKMLVAIEVL